MSFSANWKEGVSLESIDHDLSLERAELSPPLESMSADVKDAVASAARAAAKVIDALPEAPNGFKVTAYGHVRQGENDPSTTTVQVAERTDADGS